MYYLCPQNRSVPHPQKFSINQRIAIIQRAFEEKKGKRAVRAYSEAAENQLYEFAGIFRLLSKTRVVPIKSEKR